MAGALIDLGERHRPDPEPIPRRPRHRDRVRRNWPLVSVALAVLVAATLSASHRPPELVEVASIGVDEQSRAEFMVDGTALYLRGDSPVTNRGVDRYSLV